MQIHPLSFKALIEEIVNNTIAYLPGIKGVAVSVEVIEQQHKDAYTIRAKYCTLSDRKLISQIKRTSLIMGMAFGVMICICVLAILQVLGS